MDGIVSATCAMRFGQLHLRLAAQVFEPLPGNFGPLVLGAISGAVQWESEALPPPFPTRSGFSGDAGLSFNNLTVFIREDGALVTCIKEAINNNGGDCPFPGDLSDPDNVCRVRMRAPLFSLSIGGALQANPAGLAWRQALQLWRRQRRRAPAAGLLSGGGLVLFARARC